MVVFIDIAHPYAIIDYSKEWGVVRDQMINYDLYYRIIFALMFCCTSNINMLLISSSESTLFHLANDIINW